MENLLQYVPVGITVFGAIWWFAKIEPAIEASNKRIDVNDEKTIKNLEKIEALEQSSVTIVKDIAVINSKLDIILQELQKSP